MAYHSPTDLDTALRLAALDGGCIVAGGTDLYPAMKRGQDPAHYLDLTQVEGLSSLSITPDAYRFGAAMRWSQIANANLPPAFASLQEAAREVGSIQIQNAGTIAGNLCNASPAADGVPPLLTLEAEVEIARAGHAPRRMPLQNFITGVRTTRLAEGEIVSAIIVPTPPQNSTSAFEKLGTRRYLVISIAMVSALIATAQGKITHARIAVGACSPVAQRLTALEAACIGKSPAEVQVSAEHLEPLSPIDDIRGSADYRQDAVAEICLRAIHRAAGHE